MEGNTSRRIGLEEYWRILTRKKKFILIPLIITVGIAIGGSYRLSPVFESSSTILIEERQSLSRSLEELLQGDRRPLPSERIATLALKIQSPAYIRKVINALKLNQDPSLQLMVPSQNELEERILISSLKRRISIEPRGSDIFRIVVKGEDPHQVFLLAKTVTDVFFQETLESQLQEAHSLYTFSVEQLAVYQKKLAEAEDRLRRFKQGMVLSSIADNPVTEANLSEANSFLQKLNSSLQESETKLQFYERECGGLAKKFFSNSHLTDLRSRLVSLESNLPSLLIRNSWTHPEVINLNNRISALKDEIRGELTKIVNREFESVDLSTRQALIEYKFTEMEISSLQLKRNALADLIERYKRKLVSVPNQELTLARLEQEVEANRQIYNTLLEQAQATELSSALEQVKVGTKYKIIEPPKEPMYPISPNRLQIGLIACLLGLFFGVSFVFLSEYLDHSLKTVEDVESFLGCRVLGTIPKIPAKR